MLNSWHTYSKMTTDLAYWWEASQAWIYMYHLFLLLHTQCSLRPHLFCCFLSLDNPSFCLFSCQYLETMRKKQKRQMTHFASDCLVTQQSFQLKFTQTPLTLLSANDNSLFFLGYNGPVCTHFCVQGVFVLLMLEICFY